ncbi:hypothetical protein HHS34_014220 [Acidithiobacillus montserratensis]|uniref:Uncharacterized protein n=1 Tax=Acidithiobacillus montserratensis TaxID=2729135 RepID=A0ACD5HF15_9PROT|nr:hypothetical protein [Acidithiobacillus montserratensis]MBU2748499.1 hypothetical protein [Acidithiobacillus montserratensis]
MKIGETSVYAKKPMKSRSVLITPETHGYFNQGSLGALLAQALVLQNVTHLIYKKKVLTVSFQNIPIGCIIQ